MTVATTGIADVNPASTDSASAVEICPLPALRPLVPLVRQRRRRQRPLATTAAICCCYYYLLLLLLLLLLLTTTTTTTTTTTRLHECELKRLPGTLFACDQSVPTLPN